MYVCRSLRLNPGSPNAQHRAIALLPVVGARELDVSLLETWQSGTVKKVLPGNSRVGIRNLGTEYYDNILGA